MPNQREAERRIERDNALQAFYACRLPERPAREGGRQSAGRPTVTPALRELRAAGGHQVLTEAPRG